MGRFKKTIAKLYNRWADLGRAKKLSIGIFISSVILAAIIYYLTIGRINYVPLFTNLDIKDSGLIVENLEQMNITNYKIEDGGTTILASEKEVDRLRLDLAIDGVLPNSGNGFELFDNASFAITDGERKILYQRALEGELQRSIMTLQEIDYARVHLAMSEETIFTKEVTPGSASIVLRVKSLNKLSQEKVRGIISLVSAAVNNLPEENVKVIDTDGNLLSFGVINNEGLFSSSNGSSQRMEIEQRFKNQLEEDLIGMLEKVLGIGNVIVRLNAELDLDSQESTTISYDKEGVIRSQQIQIDGEGDFLEGIGQSPIDNNTQNYIDPNIEGIVQGGDVSSYGSVTNNEIGETTTYTIKAPGEVKRITTSIVYNGNLTPEKKEAIRNIVESATGFNAERGDNINVEDIAFDTTYQDRLQEELGKDEALLKEREAARKRMKLFVGIPVGIIVTVLVFLIIFNLFRRTKKKVQVAGTTISETIPMVEVKPPEPLIDIVAQETTEEKSIKNFAKKNPEKLADLVKAWIIEDER